MSDPGAKPSVPWALVQDGSDFLRFEGPRRVIEARTTAEVADALRESDAALAAGLWVAGFLTYEAAAAFGLQVRSPDPDGLPLLWLGVFAEPSATSLASLDQDTSAEGPVPGLDRWRPGLAAPDHAAALARLHEHIAAGDTYQVNFTFPLAGVERAHLLAESDLREAVVPVSTLRPGQRLWLANSVRGLVPAEYVGALEGTRNQGERAGAVA